MDIYQKIVDAKNRNETFWIVTVTEVIGSTPARAGMKMLVYETGAIDGTIGGGEIEKLIIDKIVSQKPDSVEKWKYNLGTSDESSELTHMECGGIQEVMIEPIQSKNKLYIIGGGHCGIALCNLASLTDFAVTVLDNREEWASREKHPAALECKCIDYNDVANYIKFSIDSTYIAIMTHNHKYDEFVLKILLDKEYKYLGMIGSERKVSMVFQRMIKEGYSKEKIKNVYSPIGLNIGSHTPAEIAISIMAQIISVRYGRIGNYSINQNQI